jgi:hypothetical protein
MSSRIIKLRKEALDKLSLFCELAYAQCPHMSVERRNKKIYGFVLENELRWSIVRMGVFSFFFSLGHLATGMQCGGQS